MNIHKKLDVGELFRRLSICEFTVNFVLRLCEFRILGVHEALALLRQIAPMRKELFIALSGWVKEEK